MSDVVELRGIIEAKKMEAMERAAEAERMIKGMISLLKPSYVEKLENIKTGEIARMAERLDILANECERLKSEIKEIRRDLGE